MATIVTLANLTLLVAVVGPMAVLVVGFGVWDRGPSGRRTTLLVALAAVAAPTLLAGWGLLVLGRHGIVSMEGGYGPQPDTAATAHSLGLVTAGLAAAACLALGLALWRGRRAALVALATSTLAWCVLAGAIMWWVERQWTAG
jgi:hypothetical protein